MGIKMGKQIIISILALSIMILASGAAFAETIQLKNTTIDYTSYREVVADEAGAVYLIKIINNGLYDRGYQIIPDSQAIRSIGTYRIDPSDIVTVKSGGEQTAYFYLAVENPASSRIVIPVNIISGSEQATFELVARVTGPFLPEEQKTANPTQVFKIVLAILLIIIIILAIIFAFRKTKRKKDEEGNEEKTMLNEDMKSYY